MPSPAGVPVFVATRGQLARRVIRERRPRAVVAVACERDMVSGLHDVAGKVPVLAINGTIEESGVASAVMGNPINAVAWLANKLHEYGVTPEPGHVILSGSFIKAIPFKPGDSVVALFDQLGEVTFTAE